MTTDPRAVEIIAEATAQHHLDPDWSDADGHDRCVCGGWAEGEMEPGWDDHMADATDALAALAAAGWSLLPPGGQTGEVWRCVYLDTGGAFIAHSRDALERHCAVTRCHDPGPLDPPPRPWQHQTAQRTVWPDGREHTTPWQPSDTPGEPA